MLLPHERERIKNALLQAGLSGKQIEDGDLVDKFFAVAEELHRTWVRHTPKHPKLAPKQETECGEGRSPPD